MVKSASESYGVMHIEPSFQVEEVLRTFEHCDDEEGVQKCNQEELASSLWYSEELTSVQRKVIDDGVEAILFGGLLHAASRSFETLVVQGTAAAELMSRTSSQKRNKNSSVSSKGGTTTSQIWPRNPGGGGGPAQSTPGLSWPFPPPSSHVDQPRMAPFVAGDNRGGGHRFTYHSPGHNVDPTVRMIDRPELHGPYSGSAGSAFPNEHRGRHGHESLPHSTVGSNPAQNAYYSSNFNDLGPRAKYDGHEGRSRDSSGSREQEWQRRKDNNRYHTSLDRDRDRDRDRMRYSTNDSHDNSRSRREHVRRSETRSRSIDNERTKGRTNRIKSDDNNGFEPRGHDRRKSHKGDTRQRNSHSPSRSNRNASPRRNRNRSDDSSVASYSSSSSRSESSYESKRGRRRHRKYRRASPERRRSSSSNDKHQLAASEDRPLNKTGADPVGARNETSKPAFKSEMTHEKGPVGLIHGELENPRKEHKGGGNEGKTTTSRSGNMKRKDRHNEKSHKNSGQNRSKSNRRQRRRKRSSFSDHS